MAAGTMSASSAAGGKRRRRPVMSEINVTPFVDVMLVLLIVFMVSAPLLTVGVPIDLPQSEAKALQQDNEPLTVSVNVDGQVYLQDKQIELDDLVPKLKAIIDARHGDP
ncbi:MAG: biopolymer transporter ExbD, partial [Xanthobacteraceae bacterium]